MAQIMFRANYSIRIIKIMFVATYSQWQKTKKET